MGLRPRTREELRYNNNTALYRRTTADLSYQKSVYLRTNVKINACVPKQGYFVGHINGSDTVDFFIFPVSLSLSFHSPPVSLLEF